VRNANAALADLGNIDPENEALIRKLFEDIENSSRLQNVSRNMSAAIVDPILQGIENAQDLGETLDAVALSFRSAVLRALAERPAQALAGGFFNVLGPLFGLQHGGMVTSNGMVQNYGHGGALGFGFSGLLRDPFSALGAGGSRINVRESGRDEFIMPAQQVGMDMGVRATSDPATKESMQLMNRQLAHLIRLAQSGGGNMLGMTPNQATRGRFN
jgi:hypothetical protein